MNNFTRWLIFFGLITASKAHHFIKLVILAGLGLGGLWMLHTLAQDYHKIKGGEGGGGGGIGEGAGKIISDTLQNFRVFEKRSINTDTKVQNHPEINWEFVLSRDPARCARSFICQLAAQEDEKLDDTEKNMLRLTRYSSQKDTWASKQLQEALKYGENALNPAQCMKMYKLCPYTSRTMANLLRLFGG